MRALESLKQGEELCVIATSIMFAERRSVLDLEGGVLKWWVMGGGEGFCVGMMVCVVLVGGG